MSDDKSDEENEIPSFLKLCLENARINCVGNKQNRYSENIHKCAIYLFIRGGKKLYDFLHLNMNLPSLKTVRRKMIQYRGKLLEGHLYFDELDAFLTSKGYPREVSIMEDGTKISERVEYDATEKIILGLVSSLQKKSGMPEEKFFSAMTAKQIVDAIQNNKTASYVQVILAKPNVAGEFFHF